MSIPTITALPTPPSRGDAPSTFNSAADAFFSALPSLVTEINAATAAIPDTVLGIDFTGTSSTSVAIGTGSKSFTASTGKNWYVGQPVRVASTASPSNYMDGQVTAYNSSTGALTVNVTGIGGTGTLAAWTIGPVPGAGSYATLIGTETLTNKTLTTPVLSATASGTVAGRMGYSAGFVTYGNGTAERTLVTTNDTQTLSGKTFSDSIVATHQASGTTGAVVIRDAAGDPGGGYIQFTNNARASQYSYIRGVSGSIQFFGNIHPITDNGNTCGLAGARWSVVYAGTGTINTSDERFKVWRGGLTEAEVRAGMAIISELGFYQWADAVAVKGDNARLHFGARAQRVWAIMAKEGLIDPINTYGRPGETAYAFLCFDEWEAKGATAPNPGKKDASGNWVETPTPGEPGRPAGFMYGLRIDQLALFLTACLAAKLAA